MDMLNYSWQKISAKRGSPGIDNVDLSFYRSDLKQNLRTLQAAVSSNNYRPYADKVFNRKNREICISSVDDKIIQTAVAEIIMSVYVPPKSVHGFIKNKSIFTAKKALDGALSDGISDLLKLDIKRFYDSINTKILLERVAHVIGDKAFIKVVELLLNVHSPGISTGSCLSPALSNLYLGDFDMFVEQNSVFYSRYVDDILVAPAQNIEMIDNKLSEIGLEVNIEKSREVNVAEGFRYLGFDIKHFKKPIEDAVQSGNFALAEKIYETQECDVIDVEPLSEKIEIERDEYEIPTHIKNVVKKCHIVAAAVNKAKLDRYLGYPEKTTLLQIFHCLGKDGEKFIHHILSHCSDYDYAETQRYIKKYTAPNPLGCKKLCERYDKKDKCSCNFSQEKMYPTPIIHALRIDKNCFTPSTIKDSIGHFKSKMPQDKAEDALSSLLALNKKAYEIQEQQNIFKGQIESLFERNSLSEVRTPLGMLVKTDDGLFVKVG